MSTQTRHAPPQGLSIHWLSVRPLSPSSRAAWITLAIAASVVVFVIDVLSGSELSLSLFYLVPVAAATWFVGRWAGLMLSLLCTVGWLAAYLLNQHYFSHPAILYWNLGVELGVYTSLALALSEVKRGIAVELGLMAELDRELEQVRDIQRQLLPAESPQIPGYRIALHYVTSTRAGGDYYDFFALRDGRYGFLIADASGHGTPAAVVMAMTRALAHAAPEALESPVKLLARLNRELVHSILRGQFVTACYVALDPATGRLDYALAGHNPPYRVSSGKAETFKNLTGPPLGIVEGARFSCHSMQLEPGDLLALYTDGITEAPRPDGALFGDDRLRDFLVSHRESGPEIIRDRLLAEIDAHTGPGAPADDRTLVLVQMGPRTVVPAPSRRETGTHEQRLGARH